MDLSLSTTNRRTPPHPGGRYGLTAYILITGNLLYLSPMVVGSSGLWGNFSEDSGLERGDSGLENRRVDSGLVG